MMPSNETDCGTHEYKETCAWRYMLLLCTLCEIALYIEAHNSTHLPRKALIFNTLSMRGYSLITHSTD